MRFDKQTCFILKDVGSNLDKNHIVYTVKILFEIFKETRPELFKKDKKNKAGRKKIYKKEEMLPFISWGHIMEITSCRSLENWWKNNDETCQFLLNCKKPSKTTINDFMNNNVYLIDEFDDFIVQFGLKTCLIEGKIIYGDGTILKGYCNPDKKMYPDQIEYLKDFIIKYYNEYKNNKSDLWFKLHEFFYNGEYHEELKEFYKKLKQKINSNGIRLLKLSLKDYKGLKRVLKRLKKILSNIGGKNSISIVDPETRYMENKQKQRGLNYNYQLAIDDKTGMIITHYITQHPNDQKESIPLINRIQQRLKINNFTLVLDNGYWNTPLLHRIHKMPVKLIIPHRRAAMEKNAKRNLGKRIRYDKNKIQEEKYKNYNFKYFPEEDAYLCPKGAKLTRANNIQNEGITYKQYRTKECTRCRYHDECTSEYKKTIKDRFDPILDDFIKDYHSDYGQEAYKGRGPYIEGGFGILFESRNFKGLKRRGVKKANLEMTLTVITHNIKKIHKHINNKELFEILQRIKKEKVSD